MSVSYTHLDVYKRQLLDSGRVVGEGTPLALKNTYAGDHITLYLSLIHI